MIKNKNADASPFSIKETEYDFVDPCPEEMKQVRMCSRYNLSKILPNKLT